MAEDSGDAVALLDTSAMEDILHSMHLTHPGDPLLLQQLFQWIQGQRPNYKFTTILSLSVLLQRMARAFSCRSKATTTTTSSTTAMTSAKTTTTTTTGSHPSNTNPSTTAPAPPTGQSTTAPPTTVQTQAQPAPPPQKPKKKAFRSVKKLDLSPKVVESLKGFVADLAATIPLIVKYVAQEEQKHPGRYRRENSGKSSKEPTAVDIIDICLELLESEWRDSTTSKHSSSHSHISSHSHKSRPNTAMELFRTVLAKATSTNNNRNAAASPEEIASKVDQFKFRKFTVATLECAQKSTVDAVEAFHDFTFLWKMCHEQQQQSLGFAPTKGTEHQQEELAWKLGYYSVWQHQEERPALCSRRDRILAAAASMTILCSLPLLHRHSLSSESETTTTNKETKEPEKSLENAADASGKDPSATEQQTSEDNKDDKRPLEADTNDSLNETAASKVRKVSTNGDVHDGVEVSKGDQESTEKKPTETTQEACEECLRQERALQIVLDSTRQVSSFLKWVAPHKEGGDALNHRMIDTELSRKELEQEILKVTRDLADFSSHTIKTSDSWVEVLKSAIGMKDKDDSSTTLEAEEAFLKLMEESLEAMQREEDARLGTRVEAVAYTNELSAMSETNSGYIAYLCQTTSARRKRKDELIACIPGTSHPSLLVDDMNNSTPRDASQTPGNNRPAQQAGLEFVLDEAHNAFINHNRAVSPPVMTEPMELNEWTIAVLSSLTLIRPSFNLRSALSRVTGFVDGGKPEDGAVPRWENVVVPLLNRFLSRMRAAVTGQPVGSPMPMTVGPDGLVRTSQRTQDTQLWAAIIQVYYHALESILCFEKKAANKKLMLTEAFHEALLACCYLCVARAVTITGKMHLIQPENHQIFHIMPITGTAPYTYLKVTESFLRALTAIIPGDSTSKELAETYGILPRILQKEVKNSEVHVIESLIWTRGHDSAMNEACIVNTIAELKQARQWPPECLEPSLPEEVEDMGARRRIEEREPDHPEFVFVSFVMRKLLKTAYFRIQSICRLLDIPIEYPVAAQVWLAFRFLLRNHVELLYGRHVDHFVLCTVYGICKVMKYEPDITFARIIEVYVTVRGEELGERTCQAIVRHVTIMDGCPDDDENGSDQSYGATKIGNIIRLYNLVFVPVMKGYLLHSQALRRNAGVLRKELKQKKSEPASEAGKRKLSQEEEPITMMVREGNVSVQLSFERPLHNSNSETTARQSKNNSTTSMMIDQQRNDITMENVPGAYPWDYPGHSTFLQFGQASGPARISVANKMIEVHK